MNVGIYIRVSTEDQRDGYSLDAQEHACRQEAAARGWAVYKVYADEGISAKTTKRPQLQAMRADLAAGRIQAVIVHKTDRLMRNLRLLLELIDDIQRHRALFVSVLGEVDLSTPSGLAMFQVQGALAEWQINNLREETRKGLAEKARQGGWVGPVPLGYERQDGRIVPSADAPAVQRMFSLYAGGGHSYRSIADDLNAAGWRALDWQTGQRRLFGRESVRTILKSRAYCGYTTSGGQEHRGSHAPLIDESVWGQVAALRAAREQRGGNTSPRQEAPSLLSQIAYCASCGEPLWQHRSGPMARRYHYYRCAGRDHRTCDTPQIRADIADQQALALVNALALPSAWLTRAGELLLMERPEPVAARFDPAAIDGQLKRLGLVYADGLISKEDYERKRDYLRDLLAQPQPEPPSRIEAAAVLAQLKALPVLIEAATVDERRQILRLLFAKVWLGEGELKAIAPTERYQALIGAICWFGVADGRQSGATNKTALRPVWVAPHTPAPMPAFM